MEEKKEFCFNGLSKETVLRAIKNMGTIPEQDFDNFAKTTIFVDAEYEVLGQFLIEMKIPDPAVDKYMDFVCPNPLVCWGNRVERQIIVLNPGPHWSRNLLAQQSDGSERQKVVRRNFWVDAGCLGQTVSVVVTLKKQINYHNNSETLLMDIQQCLQANPAEPIYEIGQVVKILDPVPDWVSQFIIPGTDRAIRFSKKRATKSLVA